MMHYGFGDWPITLSQDLLVCLVSQKVVVDSCVCFCFVTVQS